MGALGSLSRSATIVGWDISVVWTLAFGALFLFGWLCEEFAQSERWRAYRRLFLTLAIVGVIGEQLGTVAEFVLSAHLETIDEMSIASLSAKAERFRLAIADARRDASNAQVAAKEAKARIADADARAKEADARAAEANQKAEKERLARLKIEERFAPRRFTAQQEAEIIAALAPFAGQKITVLRTSNDSEEWGFEVALADLLSKARWTVRLDGLTTTPIQSLQIVVDPKDRASNQAAGTLQRALDIHGFIAFGRLRAGMKGIEITVGYKL
jgi:hypothetical protein